MTCRVCGEFVRETDDAILVRDEALDEEIWWPFSQIDRIDWDKEKKYVTLSVPDWLAVKKGVL